MKSRVFWISLLKEHGSRQDGLDYVAESQPFHFRLMRELLAFVEDADRNFLPQGESGFSVGVLNPLPRSSCLTRSRLLGVWKVNLLVALKLSAGGRSCVVC